MLKEIYFELVNKKLITSSKLVEIAYVHSLVEIPNDDYDRIRDYAKTCEGIVREIEHPSVKQCIINGDKFHAVKIFYDTHPDIGLKESRDIVNEMEEALREEGKL